MPQVTYDGQSFLIDGRRIWLVSGSIHYPRVPRDLWRDRIRAAKQAGLNCIDTYVFWNLHERSPGKFDFTGEKDLRHFIELIHAEGLYCILRPGPYICSEWDNGGLPAWLARLETVKEGPVRLRQGDQRFLEACARYLGAVMDQVRDHQATAKGGGPIVLMQAENEWFCHNPDQAKAYLRELVRYLRENGAQVPIFECNNLWQRIDGALCAWNGHQNLAGDLRQFRQIQPNAPRLVSEYWPGWFDAWGRPATQIADPAVNELRLAQMLASGAQFNLYMFHGGTNFGFWGGRSVESPACYVTTSYDYGAALAEGGTRGPQYAAVKRICTFASHFAHVFANLDPDHHTPCIATDGDEEHPLSVVSQTGTQGTVVFLFRSPQDKTQAVCCLLPHGQTIEVPLGEELVSWFVVDVNLAGAAQLSYTTLRPWAFVGRKLLVVFGPAGAQGVVSINDAPLRVNVPKGKTPEVHAHEGVTIAVLSTEQVDAAYLTGDGRLIIGASALDAQDKPVALRGWASQTAVDADGNTQRLRATPHRPAPAPKLGAWEEAPLEAMLTGESPSFRKIPGPMSLEALECDRGYGWYRLELPKGVGAKSMMAPASGDRLHFFSDGKPAALVGMGPGAEHRPQALKLGERTVILADNLGRFCYGWRLGEPKGLWDHLYDVARIRLGKVKIDPSDPPDPTPLGRFFTGVRYTQRGLADTLTWTFQHAGRSAERPVILEIDDLRVIGMIFVNDHPAGMYSHDGSARFARYVLPVPDVIKRGKNELKLALFHPYESKADASKCVRVYETKANLTAGAIWSFCPWGIPQSSAFGAPAGAGNGGLPVWYRNVFHVKHVGRPLWLEPSGLTKGQIYLNGHNLGRYFVATATGKAVGPQKRYYLPEPWIREDAENELVLFEEHGRRPDKVRVVGS